MPKPIPKSIPKPIPKPVPKPMPKQKPVPVVAPAPQPFPEVQVDQANKPISVFKWVDYSSRYGLGYVLSNFQIGVYFNDGTKMLLQDRTKTQVKYFSKKAVNTRLGVKVEGEETFDLAEYPAHMKKKCLLFQHFRKYLDQQIAPDSIIDC